MPCAQLCKSRKHEFFFAGWIKAGLTSLAGLVSGAVLMYASPLLDRVIKPDKPIANFQYEVTFVNGASDSGMVTLVNSREGGGGE